MGLSIPSEITTEAVKEVVNETKNAALTPKNHRYHFLKVNEVSIVTEPAILSQEEADKGVGFPIVKFFEEGDVQSPEESSPVATKQDLVVAEAKTFLSYYVGEEVSGTLKVVKLSEDTIIFTDPYKKHLDNDSLFLKVLYKQDEDGNLTFVRPKKFNVSFEEDSIFAEKVYEIVKELPMSQITGVEVGGKIVKITPIPGIEFESEDGELIFRCDEDGVLKTGENYSIDDDGVVRKTSEILPPQAEEVEVVAEEETTKFYLSLEQVQDLMAASGKSFNFSVGEDGLLKLNQVGDIDPALMVPGISESNPEEKMGHKDEEEEDKKKPKKGAHDEDEDEEDKKKPKKMGHEDKEDEEDKKKPKKSADEDLGDVALRLKQLEEELAKAKQKLAGSSTTDPEVGENAVKVMGRANFPVEKEHAPVDGNYQRGIFTRHIDKRLLDRRSRLQADLISG